MSNGKRLSSSEPSPSTFIPYPDIRQHSMVGDQRTAALIASDGTVDWMCVPAFDGAPVFGALVDAQRGGQCRFGPILPSTGSQAYEGHTAVVTTTWSDPNGNLSLTDALLPRGPDRMDDAAPCVIRRLRCTKGRARCAYQLRPGFDFGESQGTAAIVHAWTSENVSDSFELACGEEAWAIVEIGGEGSAWSARRATRELERAFAFWREMGQRISYDGDHREVVHHSALVLRLLTYAPTGAVVAAPTAGLPERLGGDRNYDYRYAWIRDASLALGVFATLGDTQVATHFFDWLVSLEAPRSKPLQVCYGLRGERRLPQRERRKLAGYRGSQPVVFGNRAYKQKQLGSLGYLADCAWSHLEAAGTWRPEYDALIKRCANHTQRVWRNRDSGVWELAEHADFVSSKVMSWVVLDRAVRICERTGAASESELASWQRTAQEIHASVLKYGFCKKTRAFRQCYGSDTPDAASLLIPLMGFLRADDAGVSGTIEHLRARLTIDGHLYRFVPSETLGEHSLPVGEFEGAFVPCLFWLATALAMAGRVDEAERTLDCALRTASPAGLFAEEYDPRSRVALGNYPQLFSHAACVRAVLALQAARRRA